MSDAPTRAGFVAVIGAPNAGKSTLVNRLVGAKVSIVTQKVQTTRFPVKGVAMAGRSARLRRGQPYVARRRTVTMAAAAPEGRATAR